jgi:hypothetical protein
MLGKPSISSVMFGYFFANVSLIALSTGSMMYVALRLNLFVTGLVTTADFAAPTAPSSLAAYPPPLPQAVRAIAAAPIPDQGQFSRAFRKAAANNPLSYRRHWLRNEGI